MSTKLRLSPGETPESTLAKWQAELRQAPFIFLDDLGWSSWEPTFPTTVGGMTFTDVTVFSARYRYLSGSLVIQMFASGTTGGVATGDLAFTLPFPVKIFQPLSATVYNGATTWQAGAAFSANDNQVLVFKGDGAAWPLATDRRILVSGELELENPQTRKPA